MRGVVLAGGESSRFGDAEDDKALAKIGSLPFLERIVSVVSQATDQTPVLVVRTEEQESKYARIIRDDVKFEYDAKEYVGPLAGIFGVASNVDAQWLFCCGCDMPLLAESAIRWLISQLDQGQSDSEKIDALGVEYPDGVVEPLHTIYRRKSVVERQDQHSQFDGPQALLTTLPNVRTLSLDEIPEDIPFKRSSTNVNTIEDLESLKAG